MPVTEPPHGRDKPFRVWITERRVYTADVTAGDAWEAKAYAEENRDAWRELDGSAEAGVEQVRLYGGPDFHAANGR